MKSSSEKCGSRFAARRFALHLHCLTASFALRTRALEESRRSRRLPRERAYRRRAWARFYWPDEVRPAHGTSVSHYLASPRSEERRVGKEGRSRWAPDH